MQNLDPRYPAKGYAPGLQPPQKGLIVICGPPANRSVESTM